MLRHTANKTIHRYIATLITLAIGSIALPASADEDVVVRKPKIIKEAEQEEDEEVIVVSSQAEADELIAQQARKLREKRRKLKQRLAEAKEKGDDAEVAKLEAKLAELQTERSQVLDQQLESDGDFAASATAAAEAPKGGNPTPGLIAGGATLVGIGGLALGISAVLGLIYVTSDAAGDDWEGARSGAIGLLVVSGLALVTGIPMLAVGVKNRKPRASVDATVFVPTDVQATVTWQF